MITVRERMNILSAYREVGSYRGAADICGTTHKTVKRAVLADAAGNAAAVEVVAHNYDDVRDLVANTLGATLGVGAAVVFSRWLARSQQAHNLRHRKVIDSPSQ